MSDAAIRVEGLGKRYQIGEEQPDYRTLRDNVTKALTGPFRKIAASLQGKPTAASGLESTIWALRDVSFDVPAGQVLGVIGRNGAGKSTLLKVLSRITEPTEGRATISGRVGSLLEVGTGFHRELTGRENTYLNGAVLGMTRKEIDRKFEEIVEFAGIRKFIDTPVKHYSDGMRVRLAFSVAAHLEPEILLVDEVLSVGDARFQKKCLKKMGEVGHEGRTVLFVSHKMSAVSRLCERVILLENGQVAHDGSPQEVIGHYLYSGDDTGPQRAWPSADDAPSGDVSRILRACVRNSDGEISESVDIMEPVGIEMEYEVLEEGHILMPNYHFFNEEGTELFQVNDVDPEWRGRPRPRGRYASVAWIPGNLFTAGRVFVTTCLTTLDPVDPQYCAENAVTFNVLESLQGQGARGDWPLRMDGVMRPLVEWTTRAPESSQPGLAAAE